MVPFGAVLPSVLKMFSLPSFPFEIYFCLSSFSFQRCCCLTSSSFGIRCRLLTCCFEKCCRLLQDLSEASTECPPTVTSKLKRSINNDVFLVRILIGSIFTYLFWFFPFCWFFRVGLLALDAANVIPWELSHDRKHENDGIGSYDGVEWPSANFPISAVLDIWTIQTS